MMDNQPSGDPLPPVPFLDGYNPYAPVPPFAEPMFPLPLFHPQCKVHSFDGLVRRMLIWWSHARATQLKEDLEKALSIKLEGFNL